ncbi:MAG: hypothetical protein ABI563_17965 [Specibacter sp.]
MSEFVAENVGQIIRGIVKHAASEAQICVRADLAFGGQSLGVHHSGRQGSSLLCFVKLLRFVEGGVALLKK